MLQGLFKRFSGLAYDVTIGLIREYKKTTIDLAKIEFATMYVKAIKLIRRECMISTLIVFGVVIFANAMGVVQVAVLLYAPWSVPGRIAAALSLGIVTSILPLVIVLRLFSEKRWMEMTHADEITRKAVDGYQSNGSE